MPAIPKSAKGAGDLHQLDLVGNQPTLVNRKSSKGAAHPGQTLGFVPVFLEVGEDAPAGYITLEEAARFVPGNPHTGSVWRWATRGVRGQVLATRIIGGRRMLTLADLEDFLRRLNAGAPAAEQSNKAETHRRGKQAGDALKKAGF